MSVAAPGFFVVGDAKLGASLIVWAIAERRKTVPRRTSTSWVGESAVRIDDGRQPRPGD